MNIKHVLHIPLLYIFLICVKKLPEDDLRKIEARRILDELYVKLYTVVIYSEFVGFSELFINAWA